MLLSFFIGICKEKLKKMFVNVLLVIFSFTQAEDNVMEYVFHIYCLIYNISETFMVMYLGNEIYLSSNRLSYSLFESNWIDQPQIIKKFFILFAETIKAPHVVVVAKVYPLTLETFAKVYV